MLFSKESRSQLKERIRQLCQRFTQLPPAWLQASLPPRVHLIQHLRHADPSDDRFVFLGLPAIRVAVSEPVRAALMASGRCGGPVLTIPPGLALPARVTDCDLQAPVLVLGLKNPDLAQAVGDRLAAAAGQVVALPMPEGEGFFLPALEAMALGRPLLLPDAGGTRAFCRDGENCVQPAAEAGALVAAVLALRHDPDRARRLIAAGLATAMGFSPAAERAAVQQLLHRLPQLWAHVPLTASDAQSRA